MVSLSNIQIESRVIFARMQYSVPLLLSSIIPNYYLLTIMKRSYLTINNPHFLLYWITCDFYLENKRGKKISETSRTPRPWRNYLYLAPALFLLPFSQYLGLECKKTFFKASAAGTLWLITIRAPKQSFNTKLHWQEHFHKAMLLIWLKDFSKLQN